MIPPSQDECCPSEPVRCEVPVRTGRYVPFAWQRDQCLMILHYEQSQASWILAELTFDPLICRYEERRQVTYAFPREAAGVLLARMVATDECTGSEQADRLVEWVRQRSPI